MARCSGCSGDRCSCVIRAGANVTVSGAGTPTNPYVVAAAAGGGGAVPAGSVVMYGGTAIPAGWVMANGAALNRVAFAALFAAIGTTFGAGDGTTTFNTPNLQQRFPVGAVAGGAYALGTAAGAASYTLTMANVPQHSHTMNHGHAASSGNENQAHTHSWAGWSTANEVLGYGLAPGAPSFVDRVLVSGGPSGTSPNLNGHVHAITVDAFNGTTGNAGQANPTAVPTLPPYLAINFMIKT
jgi:microcystin-dependent protein